MVFLPPMTKNDNIFDKIPLEKSMAFVYSYEILKVFLKLGQFAVFFCIIWRFLHH